MRSILARTAALALVGGLTALAGAAPAAQRSEPLRPCRDFPSQAAAQDYFVELGGAPARPLGGLDPDRDGLACEGLPGPYAGYATIGYNRAGSFIFGRVRMPEQPGGDFACLQGNRHFPEAPRTLRVYRQLPSGDRPVSRVVGAAADPASGLLVWKLQRGQAPPPGRYYAAFEERIRLSPYGQNQCPGFRSAAVSLP